MLSNYFRGVVLISEDPFVSRYLRCLLERHGYHVVESEAHQAAELVRSGAAAVDLLITNTPAVFQPCAEQTPVLYLSAFPDLDQVPRFRHCHALRKPFDPDELLALVEDLAGSAAVA